MYYKRTWEDTLRDLARFYPVITLCGGRQSGKTTLLKKVFPEYTYVSLDLPSIAALAEQNPSEFFATYPTPLIVDEIQYAPGLFRHLKSVVDSQRHTMGQFILTGSQKFSLMKEVSDSLAGRSVILDLETLSWKEIRNVIQEKANRGIIQELMVRGQFPELWRVRDLPAQSFYHSYLATYLERDVRQILNVTSLRDFERFIRVLAPRSGQLLNKSELAKDVGVSVKAINDWIGVLQASNQIVLLEPWFRNITKRIVKTPKFYFCDSGLLCFLLGISLQNLSKSPFKGQVWETFVFSELRKTLATFENPAQLWFYRDQQAREIDFVLEKAGTLSFLECKWTENPGKDDIKTIINLDSELKTSSTTYKPGNHYLICSTPNPYPLNDHIQILNLDSLDRATAL